jgi:hypothetical protein
MCMGALFVETAPLPPEHEKQGIDVFTAWLQHNTIFVEYILVPTEHEK